MIGGKAFVTSGGGCKCVQMHKFQQKHKINLVKSNILQQKNMLSPYRFVLKDLHCGLVSFDGRCFHNITDKESSYKLYNPFV